MSCYLCTHGQVVVDSERDLGLLAPDDVVGQREVDEERFEGLQLGLAGDAQPLLLRQSHGLRDPRGDGVGHLHVQLGLP